MKKPLKILYLITKSNYGGAQKYVFELAKAAKEAGHDVSVACGGTGEASAATGHLAEKLKAESIPVLLIKNFMRNMSPKRDLLAFFEVWKLVRKERPDVLHISSTKAGGIGALAGRLNNTKHIIFTSHGLTIDEVWRPRWQRFLIYIGTWVTFLLAHQNIMINTESLKRSRKMPLMRNKISLIKNGIAPIEFLDKGPARAKLAPAVPQKSVWVGGIGELHPNKNWSSAILAMKNVPQKVHLVIIGEGQERNKLEQLIVQEQLQNRVHLLGYKEGARYLKAFDVYLLPSKKEGLPYVLLEAGLAELPVIASDLPGIRDIITTGENGLLVEPSSDQIAISLQVLTRDHGMSRRLGLRLRELVQEKFSIKTMYQSTFKLYESSSSID